MEIKGFMSYGSIIWCQGVILVNYVNFHASNRWFSDGKAIPTKCYAKNNMADNVSIGIYLQRF